MSRAEGVVRGRYLHRVPPFPVHSLQWFMEFVKKTYGEAKAQKLWEKMGTLCVKTIVSILPTLVRDYRALFGHQDPASGQ